MKNVMSILGMVVFASSLAACSNSHTGQQSEAVQVEADTAIEATPVPTAPPQAPAAPSQRTSRTLPSPTTSSTRTTAVYDTHVVRKGDTLMKIAFAYFGDVYQWQHIWNANRDRLHNPNVLAIGTVLKIERPKTPVTIARKGKAWRIGQNDTLFSISEEVYGTPEEWERLYHNNRQLIRDPREIYAGFTLYYAQ